MRAQQEVQEGSVMRAGSKSMAGGRQQSSSHATQELRRVPHATPTGVARRFACQRIILRSCHAASEAREFTPSTPHVIQREYVTALLNIHPTVVVVNKPVPSIHEYTDLS